MAVAKLGNFESFTAKHLATHRLFCLHGENEALVRERVGALRRAFAAAGPEPAVIDIDGDTLAREPFALADEIGSMSLFAERRLLRVTLGARAAEEAFAKALPVLANADGVLVVIDAGTDKRQADTVRLLSADRSCLVVACPMDDEDELAVHATRVLAEAGLTIERETALELVALTDGDRGLLANELAKLLLMATSGDTIALVALRHAVADEGGTLLDEAADRILAGDVRAAFDAADRLGGAGAVLLAGAALRKALWAHRNASGTKAANLRRAIARLNDVVLADRSSDKLAGRRADLTLIRTAQFLRR